jgi:nifR3 family TIM-barrel protein
VTEASKGALPVTVKMRKGIDDDHLTFIDAARAAERAGVAAVALHARTASQHYSGEADWSAIAQLKAAITSVPVLGNGDIWTADDALRMMHETGCDGVVIGRGCLGRPWLFGDLEAALAGRSERLHPDLGHVIATMQSHAQLLVEHHGDERTGCRDFRKHIAWYTKGYTVGNELRTQLVQIESLAQLDELVAQLDATQLYPGEIAEGKRGKQGMPKRVVLPEGWIESRDLSRDVATMMQDAELATSGG